MASRIQRAQDALSALIGTLSGVRVIDNDDVPVAFVEESTAVVNLTDGDDVDGSPRFVGGNIVEIDTQVVVAGYVTGNSAASLRAAREALFASVWALVLGNPRLSDDDGDDITWDVLPGPAARRIETEPGKPVAVFELPVMLRVKAKASDLAIAA